MSNSAGAGPGLWIRVQHRFGPRMPEWFMAAHMAAFGVILMVAHGLFEQATWSGFRALLFISGDPAGAQRVLGMAMLVAGLARFGGLIVNGARKDVTPRIRQVSAGMGCLIWAGIVYGFWSSDVLSTWAAIYPIFVLEELTNIHRAAHDEGEARNGTDG